MYDDTPIRRALDDAPMQVCSRAFGNSSVRPRRKFEKLLSPASELVELQQGPVYHLRYAG